MGQTIRDLLLAHRERAKEKKPATDIVTHLLEVDAELGEGNDGLLGLYLEEVEEELASLLHEIKQKCVDGEKKKRRGQSQTIRREAYRIAVLMIEPTLCGDVPMVEENEIDPARLKEELQRIYDDLLKVAGSRYEPVSHGTKEPVL